MSVYEIISITVAVIGITTAAIGIFTFSIRTRQSREEVISASIINLVIIAIVTVASMILFISTTIPILITHTFSSNHSFLLFGVFIVIAFIAFVGAFIIFQIVYQSRLVDKLEQNERNVQNFKREYEADKVRRVEEYREKIRNDELLRTTQRNIRNDLRTKKVQIIDMSSPLSMEDVYIPLKLQKLEETIRPLNLDGTQLGEAEAMHDPNALLEQIKAIRRRFDDHPNAVLNADQAIREHKHCIIVGDPGSGKTTLLKYLVLQSAKGELEGLPNLPIHVHLNEFAYYKGSDDLLDFALSKWDERYGLAKEETSVHLQEHLAAGNVLFLLDAIDEVGIGSNAKQSSERVSKAIMQLAETYKESYIVITARKAGYEQQQTSLTGFTELEVLCFSAEDIRTFVNNWFDTQESETREANASDLNIKLENNLRIQTLASNPLLLSLIVMLYEKELKLPDRRAELYKQCVEMLLSKWDVSRGIYRQSEFTIERKRQLLKHVAWTCHEKRRFFFPKRELLNTIADYLLMAGEKDTRDELLPKAEQVLDEIAIENGLLKEHSTDFYGFLHLSVQE